MNQYKKFQVDISNTDGEASFQRFVSLLDEVTLLHYKNFAKFFSAMRGKKFLKFFFQFSRRFRRF